MKIVLLGPPGAGKGTQGQLLCQHYHVPHIATGDMIREEISHQTLFGMQVQSAIAAGNFAPDEAVIQRVEDRLRHPDCIHGFILDGFPRDLAQAQAWEHYHQRNDFLDCVLNLDISENAVISRLAGRLVCPSDGTIYHLEEHPPKVPFHCDNDGAVLVRRADDEPEAIHQRLQIYRERTEPLIDYYAQKGILITVNAEQDPAAVNRLIIARLSSIKLELVEV